jgi:hypothetical protein
MILNQLQYDRRIKYVDPNTSYYIASILGSRVLYIGTCYFYCGNCYFFKFSLLILFEIKLYKSFLVFFSDPFLLW